MAGSYVDGVSGAGNEVTGEPGATDATGTTGAGIEATGAGIEAIETVGAHGATETFDACATTGVGNEATSATEGGLAIATTGPRTSSFPFAIFLLRGLFHRSRSRCQINVFVLDQNNNAYLGIVDMCVCRSNNHFPLPVTRVEAHLLLVTRGRRKAVPDLRTGGRHRLLRSMIWHPSHIFTHWEGVPLLRKLRNLLN